MGSSRALRRYVSVGITRGVAQCSRSLAAGEVWARTHELDKHVEPTSITSGEEMERALANARLREGDVLHLETHGAWDDDFFAFWFGRSTERFVPRRAPEALFAPSLVLVGACHAGTEAGLRVLAGLFDPGVPLIACAGDATWQQVANRVLPALDEADVVRRGVPPRNDGRSQLLVERLSGDARNVSWLLGQADLGWVRLPERRTA